MILRVAIWSQQDRSLRNLACSSRSLLSSASLILSRIILQSTLLEIVKSMMPLQLVQRLKSPFLRSLTRGPSFQSWGMSSMVQILSRSSLWKSKRLGTSQSPPPWRCLTAVQGWTQAESRAFMLQQFLRLIGAREALWANHPSSGYYLVTETYTTDIPAPDGPQGLDGGATLRISDNNPGGQNITLQRPKLLSPKYRTQIGTRNVRTMFQTGKVHQVAREMKRLGLAILGVGETRWTGTGKVQLACGETVLYSGLAGDNAPHERGVAMILSKEAVKSLKEWEPISERIITARLESKCQATRVIQVYAPTNDAEEDEKEDFYHQLQTTLSKGKSRDLALVIGDLNAKVGSDNTNREMTMGTHGEGDMNENGELFCNFCATNGLVIGGTLFPHRKSH